MKKLLLMPLRNKLQLKLTSLMSMLLLLTAGLVITPHHNMNFGWNGLSKTPHLSLMPPQSKKIKKLNKKLLKQHGLLPQLMLNLLKQLLLQPMQLTKLQLKMLQLRLPGTTPLKLTLLPLLKKLLLKSSMMNSKHGLHSENQHSPTTGTLLKHGKKLGLTINAMPLKKQPRLT